MVTLTDSTLRATVYETIYDLINGISAWGLSSSNSVTVTSAFIDKDETFPQVVIHPVDVDNSDFTFDKSLMYREIRVLIEVYSKKRKDLDQMADKILSTIEAGSTAGMRLVDTNENTAMNAPAGLKLHSKSITLTYVRRS